MYNNITDRNNSSWDFFLKKILTGQHLYKDSIFNMSNAMAILLFFFQPFFLSGGKLYSSIQLY